jgi:hypothetical protein
MTISAIPLKDFNAVKKGVTRLTSLPLEIGGKKELHFNLYRAISTPLPINLNDQREGSTHASSGKHDV